jgi:two-component system cell cycle sensor histidine kinase/response regulator CckA
MFNQGGAGANQGNESVLVVEDDDAVREVISTGLRKLGYQVLPARNGDDALAVADSHGGPIHLVISDLVMPEMNGVELFARLRGWYPAMRFLFVSGYLQSVAGDMSDDSTAFLPKPFTIDRLAHEGRVLLDRRPARITQPRMGAISDC